MPHFEPINDAFIDIQDGAYISIADALSLKGKQTIEAVIDCQLDSLPGGTYSIFGKSATADFAFTVTTAGIVAFTTRRAGGNVTSTASTAQAIAAGKRNILRGVDDGLTVKLYINGTVAATTSTAQTGALVKDTNPYTIAAEAAGTNPTFLRIFGAQMRMDGIVVFRLLPREMSGVLLRDLSGYNQAVTIAGTATEGSTFWWGSAWSREPMFTGGVTL